MTSRNLSMKTVEIAVQINGKVRARIVVAKDSTKEELEELALQDATVQEIH